MDHAALEERLGIVRRDRQSTIDVDQGAAGIAGIAPRRSPQHQYLDIVLAQADGLVEVRDRARPGLHGGVGQTAIDPEIGIVGLELQRPALCRGGPFGSAGFHPGLSGLGIQFGAQAGPVLAHVARDGFELRRGLGMLARLEHGDGDAVASPHAAAFDDPFLGRRQRPQRLHPRELHAFVITSNMIGARFQRGRSGQGLDRGRNHGNGLGERRRRGDQAEQRPQLLCFEQHG
jgi:hypothetical protein